MTPSRNPSVRRLDAIRAALIVGVLALAACGEKKEEQVQQAAPPPPPPPKQEVPDETVADVAKRLGIDARVRMDDSEGPKTGDAGNDLKRTEATLKFFDAMVCAKADALRPLLSDRDRATLAAMEADGQWKRVNEGVDRVTIGFGGDKVLAIYAVGDGFQAQFWEVSDAGDGVRFKALPSARNALDFLEGTKADPRIQQWLHLEQMRTNQASKPDEAVDVPQEDRSVQGEDSSAPAGAPAAPSGSPGGPGGPGSPRRPGR